MTATVIYWVSTALLSLLYLSSAFLYFDQRRLGSADPCRAQLSGTLSRAPNDRGESSRPARDPVAGQRAAE
ncbi:hypothetical protein AGR6A_pAt20032 [Agrobacterium sp. NCPPB 925]|nr:hypothetical protein AGR6A_pAt20032 [Agrobacterium sp. NCPPB 925]